MARNNPVFRADTFKSAYVGNAAERMTVAGAVNKSFVLILLTIFSATWIWRAQSPDVLVPAMLVGTIGGLVMALATSFRPRWAPVTAPLYAVLEGLALGAISAFYTLSSPKLQGLPMQAVGLTFMVAIGMLVAYRTGLLKATETFKRVVISATIGIFFFMMFSLVLSMFGVRMSFLWDSSPLGIALNLFIAGIAALNLILDFDLIEQGAKMGAAKYMEWYGGFALLVTLIWLYLNILRLLARMRR